MAFQAVGKQFGFRSVKFARVPQACGVFLIENSPRLAQNDWPVPSPQIGKFGVKPEPTEETWFDRVQIIGPLKPLQNKPAAIRKPGERGFSGRRAITSKIIFQA